MLKKVLRGLGPGRGKKMSQAETSFRAELKRLNLDKSRALEAERISTLPADEKHKACRNAEAQVICQALVGALQSSLELNNIQRWPQQLSPRSKAFLSITD